MPIDGTKAFFGAEKSGVLPPGEIISMGSPGLGPSSMPLLRFAADVDFSLPDDGSLLLELPLGGLGFGLERCLGKLP